MKLETAVCNKGSMPRDFENSVERKCDAIICRVEKEDDDKWIDKKPVRIPKSGTTALCSATMRVGFDLQQEIPELPLVSTTYLVEAERCMASRLYRFIQVTVRKEMYSYFFICTSNLSSSATVKCVSVVS